MNPSIDIIKRHVAACFEIPVAHMTSQRRGRVVARPRQVAMFLATKLTNQSLPAIGAKFGGRDHTTVMHAVKTIQSLIDSDPDFAATMKRVQATMPVVLGSGQVVGTDDLDIAARAAVHAVVKRAKSATGGTAAGHLKTVRDSLYEIYSERPVARGLTNVDDQVELLVSDQGTWSIVVITDDGDHAQLIASGDGWEAVPPPPSTVAPDALFCPTVRAPIPPATYPRRDKCMGCKKPFTRTGIAHRHCADCRKVLTDADNSLGAV